MRTNNNTGLLSDDFHIVTQDISDRITDMTEDVSDRITDATESVSDQLVMASESVSDNITNAVHDVMSITSIFNTVTNGLESEARLNRFGDPSANLKPEYESLEEDEDDMNYFHFRRRVRRNNHNAKK